MKRKKLIIQMIIGAFILLLISIGGHVFEEIYSSYKRNTLVQRKMENMASLTTQYQEYLNHMTRQLSFSGVNQAQIEQVASDLLKKGPVTKFYLWMSQENGEFVFGVPSAVFARFNTAFDRFKDTIEKDGHYLDRNDFLLKLVNYHEEIDFSQFKTKSQEMTEATEGGSRHTEDDDKKGWRFFQEGNNLNNIYNPIRLSLSSPVMDSNGQLVGTLFLKVEDHSLLLQKENLERDLLLENLLFPAVEAGLPIAFLFLWLLLPSWVYIDARQRGVMNCVRWAILTVVSFGFASLIYLIVRPIRLEAFECPQCSKELEGANAFCPYCGFDLSQTFCPQCQYPINSEWQFCPGCRFELTQISPRQEINKEAEKTDS